MAVSEAPYSASKRDQEIQAQFGTLQRRDWALWWSAIIVILALTGAIVSFSLSVLSRPDEPFFQFHIGQSVRGLVGVVLLFSTYSVYQQWKLRGLHGRLLEQIRIAAEEHTRAEEFMKQAMTDPLTDLHNRRYAEEQLQAEMARAKRHGRGMTVLLLDLDDFKLINDRYGHAIGDFVLKAFADRLRKSTRGSDLAARVGGDEFLALLPECRPEDVQSVLRRLSSLEIETDGKKIPVNFSAGWTDYNPGESKDELLKRADSALYVDKRTHQQRNAENGRAASS